MKNDQRGSTRLDTIKGYMSKLTRCDISVLVQRDL